MFIGNGVPVEVGQVLSKAILKSLNNMESKVTNNINLQNIQAVDYKIEIEAEKIISFALYYKNKVLLI